jgi:NAD(P)-dependent dehydrogenase (short-subunit alcohol dehydrogenase family)
MQTRLPTEMMDFMGKVVLVTGAARGLGAAVARRFAQAGADVAVCDLQPAVETCAWIEACGRKALSLTADLTDPAQVEALFGEISTRWNAVDVLVNNAGIYPSAPLLELTAEDWDRTLEADLKSVFLCTQAAARGMIAAQKGGAIVNIGSTEALTPAPGHCHYSAAKAGAVMFSRNAAYELGCYGIRVNVVSPGLIARPTLAADWPDGLARFNQRAPLARPGEPEEIADACLFLASSAASWITGAHLTVDGGVLTSPAF